MQRWIESPIVGDQGSASNRIARLILFLVWGALVAWFASYHIVWRDEVRAFSLALSGSGLADMLRTVHGEGHPAIWYLLLRGAHELVPAREVLPVVAALVGIGTAAIITFRAPFRIGIIALILFSYFSAFEFSVIARNYGIAALVMVALAALYPRIKGSLWFGVLILILANTNVPSAILAATFMLFRFVELLLDRAAVDRRQWLVFAGNAGIALLSAYLCFRTIYPTFNDGAVSANLQSLGPGSILPALLDTQTGFTRSAGSMPIQLQLLFLLGSTLAFLRRPAALAAAIAGFVGLKFFFYFIYPSSYRHEALYLVFLLCLHWMTAEGAGGEWRLKRWADAVRTVGAWALIEVLALQTFLLFIPLGVQLAGLPYSRAADVAELIRERGLNQAIIMADPDPMLESLPYYLDNPLWFLRERKFGKVVRLTQKGRKDLSLDDVLADAEMLHRQTGRPIVFLSSLPLEPVEKTTKTMYESTTTLTPASVTRFRAATRHLATLRPSASDENYDVYLFPREPVPAN